MITLYKDKKLEVLIPEDHDDILNGIGETWCTKNKVMYEFHVRRLKQTLIRFNFGDYMLSLGVDKTNFKSGQWIDNIIKDNKHTTVLLGLLEGDIFNYDKMKNIGLNKSDENISNMADKISEIPEEVKNIVLNYLK